MLTFLPGSNFDSRKDHPSQVPLVHPPNLQAVMMTMKMMKGNQGDQDPRDQRRKGSTSQGSNTLAAIMTATRMVAQCHYQSSSEVSRDR